MRYSETLVKDMHGQSAGPSYTQQREKEGKRGGSVCRCVCVCLEGGGIEDEKHRPLV